MGACLASDAVHAPHAEVVGPTRRSVGRSVRRRRGDGCASARIGRHLCVNVSNRPRLGPWRDVQSPRFWCLARAWKIGGQRDDEIIVERGLTAGVFWSSDHGAIGGLAFQGRGSA